jgi:hypothetical protein
VSPTQGRAQCLGDVVGDGDVDVLVVCERCGGSLGRYWAGARFPEGGTLTLAEKRLGTFDRTANPWPGSRAQRIRGPRTQAGLYPETFGDRQYLRKRCPCRANEKRPMDALGELPITVRDDGVVVLVF